MSSPHLFLTDCLPGWPVTPCVKAKKWRYKRAAQARFSELILHVPRGNDRMLLHWNSTWGRTTHNLHAADRVFVKSTSTLPGAWHTHWQFCRSLPSGYVIHLLKKQNSGRILKPLELWAWFSSRNHCVLISSALTHLLSSTTSQGDDFIYTGYREKV